MNQAVKAYKEYPAILDRLVAQAEQDFRAGKESKEFQVKSDLPVSRARPARVVIEERKAFLV